MPVVVFELTRYVVAAVAGRGSEIVVVAAVVAVPAGVKVLNFYKIIFRNKLARLIKTLRILFIMKRTSFIQKLICNVYKIGTW